MAERYKDRVKDIVKTHEGTKKQRKNPVMVGGYLEQKGQWQNLGPQQRIFGMIRMSQKPYKHTIMK